jgi:uncharacterized membrane protein YdbT with pleckstrin-like domain
MSYVEDNLLPNEKIILIAKISRAIYLPSLVIIFLGLPPLLCLFILSRDDQISSIFLLFFMGIFVVLSLALALRSYILISTTEFVITNRRVIAKKGLLRRSSLELLLPKVESVRVNQPILGRLFGFGTITVTGTGGTREYFNAISDPIGVRNKFSQIIESMVNQSSK